MPKLHPALNNSSEDAIELIELGNLNGALNTSIIGERVPTYETAEAETVLSAAQDRSNNSYIVIGRDRLGNLASGFGGRGYPASNAIDIVAGLASSYRDNGKNLDRDTIVGRNVFTDAARIYISQRTDLDKNFGITEGTLYGDTKIGGVSGIAAKADTVLIIGRRNVKIKAGKSKGDNLPKGGEQDAHGRTIHASTDNRIELIGAEGLTPEPVVLGDKLVDCLKDMYSKIQDNNLKIQKLLTEIIKLRVMLATHIHIDPISGVTLPSPNTIASMAINVPEDLAEVSSGLLDTLKSTIDELNRLEIPNKDKYILSKTVFTT